MGPIRSNRYGITPNEEYISSADAQLFKILQIEHIDGVRNIEQILDTDGIDGVIVGQFDLSGSLGILSKVYDEENIRQIRTVFDACRRRKIPCGISSEPKEEIVRMWLEMGACFVFMCYEYDWVRMSAGNALQMVRGLKRVD